MSSPVILIPIPQLLPAFVLVLAVAIIYMRWSLSAKSIAYGTLRMLAQLTLIGFALTYLFHSRHPALICGILSLMLIFASWIALRPVRALRKKLYLPAFSAIGISGLIALAVVILGVLRLEPWYEPRYLIPIAGMIFSNAMNAVSLAAERFEAERKRGEPYPEARRIAYQASLIPMLNAFFAVGIVSLPGMMTGQIISGIHPFIAIRYQIMVMCMLFGASGMASALYLRSQR